MPATADSNRVTGSIPMDDRVIEWLTAEEQLKNVAELVQKLTTRSRTWNGKNREYSYAASKAEIAEAARQLAEMVLLNLKGELKPLVKNDNLPF